MHYRHEWKHEITYSDMITLRQRMSAIAWSDPHAVNGKYVIRSLYFDTPDDRALREKINGVNSREKFRLRMYNHDTSVIFLEKKSKLRGLCSKQSVRLSEDEVRKIITPGMEFPEACGRDLLEELHMKTKTDLLKPKTIVEYTREPYIYAPGNVRVTFDYDIRTGIMNTDFLDPDCILIPAGDAPIVLEVKWDEFLPGPVRCAVQLTGRRSSAFSKYATCRIYG